MNRQDKLALQTQWHGNNLNICETHASVVNLQWAESLHTLFKLGTCTLLQRRGKLLR